MKLSKREKWIGLAAAAVLALLLLDQVLLSPLLARLADAEARVSQHSDELSAAQQLFDNRLRAQRKWSDMAGQTLHRDAGSTESQVLNHVRRWASDSGLTVSQLRPVPGPRDGEFQQVNVHVTGAGGIAQAAAFLYAIQTSDIPVRVADIEMTAPRSGTEDRLAVQVRLATVYLPEASTAAAGGAR